MVFALLFLYSGVCVFFPFIFVHLGISVTVPVRTRYYVVRSLLSVAGASFVFN